VTSIHQKTANEPAYSAPPPKGYRAAVAASFLGWALDAFDYWLVAYALTAIAADFGKPDKAIAASITITLVSRPIGAFVFGLLADHWGRKKTLMVNLVFFSIFGVMTGFAQTYTSFMVIRFLFGIGMGGEWGVGSSLAMEATPKDKRGIVSGLLQEGYAAGNLLAALCFFFVFPRWGWRPMFFIGGIPALLALYVRQFVQESEVWERTRNRDFGAYAKTIASHWPLLVYLVIFMTLMGFVSHGTQDMYPTFLKRDWKFDAQKVAVVNIIANFGAIAGGVLFGHFSDKWGRRKMIIGALILGLFAIPAWAFAPTFGVLVFGGVLMQFMVQGAWGVIPVHINELVPDSVRGFLPGFAYQCGMAGAGMVTYIEAVFAERMTYASAMAFTACTVFILAAIAAYFGKERHKVAFGA
jgi:SHS family lactate transporter-like MFS transporter